MRSENTSLFARLGNSSQTGTTRVATARRQLLGRACKPVTEMLERRVLMASVVGGVFEDANGNGLWDGPEVAAANRTISLTPFPSGTPVVQTTTATTGFYTFNSVALGQYLVQQVLPGTGYRTNPVGATFQTVDVTNTTDAFSPAIAFGFWYGDVNASLSALSATPTLITTEGGPMSINRTLQISGYSPQVAFNIAYFLSSDTTLDGGDIPIGTEAITSSANKQVGANAKLFDATVPAVTAGVYHVLAQVDSTNVLLKGGTAGTTASNVFVGNTVTAGQLKGNVSGHVWEDANANGSYVSGPGTYDSEEVPLVGAKVYVDSTPNSVWDTGEQFALTDVNGDYLLIDVPTGNRTIRVETAAGSQVVTPGAGALNVTIAANTTLSNQNLGVWRSAFDASWNSVTSPQSFLDSDGGTFNITRNFALTGGPVGRVFVVEYRLSADGTWNNGSYVDGEVMTTVADKADGSHTRTFDILLPTLTAGTYTLLARVDSLGVLSETNESNNTFTVGTYEAFDAGSIAGLVWEDIDGDEIKDADERGAGNRRVFLDKDGSNSFTAGDVETLTDATGKYLFNGLKPGNYTVIHDLAGALQTTPISVGYTFPLAAGEQSTDNDFGFRDPNMDLNWTSLSTSTAQLISLGGPVSVSRTYNVASSPVVRDFVIQYKLSPDGDWNNAANVTLGSETISTLTDKALGAHARTFTMNAPALAAVVDSLTNYTLLARVDTTSQIVEVNESNNTVTGNALAVYIGNEVHGSVWNDTDGDITRDASEPAGVNRRVFAEVVGSPNANGTWDAGEAFAMTNANGIFALTQLAPGSYVVRQELAAGDVQVVPTAGTGYPVNLTSGTIISSKLFGYRIPPDLKWNSLAGVPTSLSTAGGTMSITRSINIAPVDLFDDFTISYRLSVDTTWSAGDFVLGSETVSAPADKTTGDHARNFSLDFGALSAGTYYLLGRVESGAVIAESNEGNNDFVATQVTVRGSTPTTTIYLSDLNPTSQTNAWGPFERNRSNGEAGAADGATITIQGVTYAKGLGVHADSSLVYNLVGGNYTKFQSDIGVDDEVGNLGSVIFQVLLDGLVAYTSPVMTGSQSARQIDISVVGKSTMELKVLNVDGNYADHGDWANARLLSESAAPPVIPPPTGTPVYLGDGIINPTFQANGWGPYEQNRSNGENGAADGRTITLNGVTYAKGLGVHTDSVLRYNLAGGNYTRFQSDVGVDDEVGNLGSVAFQVWLDGVMVKETSVMTGASATQFIDIDVTGKTTLELRVINCGDGNYADHADWANARLYQDTTPDTTAPTPSPMTFAVAPAANGSSAITMTATTATDINGVQYFFDETSGNPGGTDSGWQDSPTYTDSGLTALTTYTYTVLVRDKSANQNLGVVSSPASATTPAAPAIGGGTGLKGEYFDNIDLTSLKLTRTDAAVNFDWGNGSPDASVGADTFSVRWTGQVQAQFTETYTFYTTTDDGVRLWVNGVQIINKWQDQGGTEWSGTIALVAGQKYDIKLEYYENGWGAKSILRWSSASTAKQVVPTSQLFVGPTDNEIPSTPGTPTLVSKTFLSANIQWAASTDNVGVTGYRIFRDNVQVGTSTTTSYSDGSLNPSTPYSYTVKAVDAAGNVSLVSGALIVTTDAAPPTGNGLKAEYYDNKDLTTLKLTRTDATVNFNWAMGSPDASVGVDTFSARWTGKVKAGFSETYTFYTSTDDGVRVWVNGVQIINKWQDQGGTEWSGTIALTAGQLYDIKVEYFENGWNALATLSWSSASQAKQIIPQAALYSA